MRLPSSRSFARLTPTTRVPNPNAHKKLYLTFKQACVANLTLRQATLGKQSTGPVSDFSKFICPLNDVLGVMTEQQRELAQYKAKFGDL